MEAPDGQDVGSVLDRPGDFSPGLLALSAYPGAGVSSRL